MLDSIRIRLTIWYLTVLALVMGRRSLSGSPIGGIKETQEMLDFCGEHDITADVEVIPIQKINEAYERLLKSDVKYRFSIDMLRYGRVDDGTMEFRRKEIRST